MLPCPERGVRSPHMGGVDGSEPGAQSGHQLYGLAGAHAKVCEARHFGEIGPELMFTRWAG
jgi:hypothetical protein